MPVTPLEWFVAAVIIAFGSWLIEPWLLEPSLRGYHGKTRRHLRRLRRMHVGQTVRVGQEWRQVLSVVTAQRKMFHRRYMLSGGQYLNIRHGLDGYTVELHAVFDYTGKIPGTVFDTYIQYKNDKYQELVSSRDRVKARIDGKTPEIWLETRRFCGDWSGSIFELMWLDGEQSSYWVQTVLNIRSLELKD